MDKNPLFDQPDHVGSIKKAISAKLLAYFGKEEAGNPKAELLPFRNSGPNSCISVLLYSQGKPVVVVKMPRFKDRPIANSSIRNEYNTLSRIGSLPEISGHIPEVIDLMEIDGENLLMTRHCQGRMLDGIVDAMDDPSEFLKTAETCLGILQSLKDIKPADGSPADMKQLQNHILHLSGPVAKCFPQRAPSLRALIEKRLSSSSCTTSFVTQKCLLHNDFNPWNILVEANGNIRVLDWEDSRPDGYPMLDLYNFFAVSFRIAASGQSEMAKKRPADHKLLRMEHVLKAYEHCSQGYREYCRLTEDAADLLFISFVLNNTLLFADEKRRSFEYALGWLDMLFADYERDPFAGFMKEQMALFRKYAK